MPDGFRIVDKARAVPVYRQVVNWMTSQIITGAWPAGLRLPGEFDLAKELAVSRGSLRKAIGVLTARQLPIQSQGKGAFVSPVAIEQPLASRLVPVWRRSCGKAGHARWTGPAVRAPPKAEL